MDSRRILAKFPLPKPTMDLGSGNVIGEDEPCIDCGATHTEANPLTAFRGETDSFGYEVMVLCKQCEEKGGVECEQGKEEELAKRVAAMGGPQPEVEFFCSALGNRDTVDECAIVKGAEAAARWMMRMEEAVAFKGDYLFQHHIEPATPAHRREVERFNERRDGERIER